MTTKKIILSLAVTLLLSSCVATSYYQVYQTQSKEKMQKDNNTLIYSDANCTIFYNFWSEGGNIGFTIRNDSEQNIYLNKKKCFFICNGYAYDYFQNRIYTNTRGLQVGAAAAKSGAAGIAVSGVNVYGYDQTNSVATTKSYGVSVANNVSNSVSWEEAEIICIPPKTAKVISEFGKITNIVIRDCDLFRHPTDKQANSSTFSEAESPLTFCNKLAYCLGDSKDLIRINNEFYVSEIKNLTEKNMIETKREREEFCGDAGLWFTRKYWKEDAPDKFYVRYVKAMGSSLKH